MKKFLAVLALSTLAACSSSNPVAPTAKVTSGKVSNSRYILISNEWVCVDGPCQGPPPPQQ